MRNNIKKEANKIDILKSLDKGLLVLEVIEETLVPVSLHELWLKLKWDKATILRILVTLERRGYIHRDPTTKGYTLGIKIYGLYNSMTKTQEHNIQQIIKPYLEKLVEKTGESAHLALVIDKSIVYINTQSSSEILCVNTKVGNRGPLHCTALGKAYLSMIDENQFDKLIDSMPKYTEKTITNVIDLRKNLIEIRKKGFSIDNEEYVVGIRCVASAISNHLDFPIAMIGISGPKDRLPLDVCTSYGYFIKKIAIEISKKFGYMDKLE